MEVYRLLPANGEPELVDAVLPARSRVLDLGCGTGRIAGPLGRRGHLVVGVDSSAEMLAQVHGAATVLARIEDLRLGQTFDAVLLASHLVNTPDPARRAALLAACRRHVSGSGLVVIQWHPPEWFDTQRVGEGDEGMLGDVAVRLAVLGLDDGGVSAVITYRVGERRWTQRFTAARITEDELRAELAAAGLVFDGWIDESRRWFCARPARWRRGM